MSEQTPTVGRVVHYVLSEQDAQAVNRRRGHAQWHMNDHRANAVGTQLHVGNPATPGETLPMIVTRVFSAESVNGQVLLDGNDTLWVATARQSTDEEFGTWHWPARV